MNRVMSDLALGVRLAVGGSRKSWARLALQGVGIGLGVALLLFAASLPSVMEARDDRQDARNPVTEGAGPAPLLAIEQGHPFRSEYIRGSYLKARSPEAPVPPGIDRVPGDGEIFVSPALAALLDAPGGELLKPRFPQKVIGTIGQAGLQNPNELHFYAGDAKIQEEPDGNTVYGWGVPNDGGGLNPVLWLLSVVGLVVLLFPVLVFVGVATRLAAAQRDRRLAALRLVGAAASRVRLIASGEALAGALAGLVVGFGIFFAVRPSVNGISIAELSTFSSDVMPAPALTVTVVVAVPVLAVVTSLVAMRRTIIEPLGVVRDQKPVRRRLWWRLVPVAAGVALLVSQIGELSATARPDPWPVVTGIVLLMLGIPVLLPWLVERVVFTVRGGSPALQLAVRRLQLDSGTAARVVGGVAVVLAGTVTLQMTLAGVEQDVRTNEEKEASFSYLTINPDPAVDPGAITAALEKTAGVDGVHEIGRTFGELNSGEYVVVTIASCEALRSQATVPDCVDGKAYVVPFSNGLVEAKAGDVLTIKKSGERWTVPAVETVEGTRPGLVVTPAAARGLRAEQFELIAVLDGAVPDVAEHTRNALAAYPWQMHTYFVGQDDTNEAERVFGVIRRALLAGSLLTLLVAAGSLLVVALEQVRERRRPLAVMAASGVPRGTLARSLLWQNALPLAISTVVSLATGIGLGVLVMRVSGSSVAFDWAGIGLVTAVVVGLTLAVTALTLPSLRRATGALGLRTE
ncbi:FtsX-like permease family protein [Lentzea xinjiangensis]|uniref:FtsX-like permease family protein n=1 Tax=Lentzea xinjiangensis TaxID=402600 RepID=A0A1H9AYD4_9PSEU|nr:FtsX-like permease family protein [Lentzea xinjiangensis]SEP81780.1 FtsX-like permease family protein [Lentzea xinjiangensis]